MKLFKHQIGIKKDILQGFWVDSNQEGYTLGILRGFNLNLPRTIDELIVGSVYEPCLWNFVHIIGMGENHEWDMMIWFDLMKEIGLFGCRLEISTINSQSKMDLNN